MAQSVFISHSSLDKTTAETVCNFLEAQGISCWMAPRNVPPGGKYGEVIIQALEEALAVILIFSERSNASEQVMNEIERAVSKQKAIFPLKISATTPSGELEYFISRRHWLDATLLPLDTLLPQLLEALRQLTAHSTSAVWRAADTGPPAPPHLTLETTHEAAITPTVTAPLATRQTPWLVGVGLVALLALALTVWFGRGRQTTPAPEQLSLPALAPVPVSGPSPLATALLVAAEAYQALEQGDPTKASALFQSLTAQPEAQIQAQGQAGLAAIALARDDTPQVLEHAAQAETLDSEVIYSHVVRGHLLWQQGKIAEATAAYRTATEKTRGLPWHQTVAYNRLGRIYAVQGDVQQALEHYDKALEKPADGHADVAAAYTNKGYVLASIGQWPEAMAHYRQAQQLNPADRLTAMLLQDAERREQAAQDRDKQERIDQLVTSLVQAYKDGKPVTERSDGWTSMPLTLAFLRLQPQGTPAARAGEEEALLLRVIEALQTTERLIVLERDMLDKVLAELRLSAAELTDSQTAVRVGRILSARLLATGSLTRRGSDVQLTVRVVETETTRLRAAITETLSAERGFDGLAEHFATALLQKLRTAYPLQGRLLQATTQQVVLNIGAEHGVTPGMTLQVLQDVPLQFGGEVAGLQLLNVGLIEVLSVEPKLAQGRVVEHTVPFEAGWKVKEP